MTLVERSRELNARSWVIVFTLIIAYIIVFGCGFGCLFTWIANSRLGRDWGLGNTIFIQTCLWVWVLMWLLSTSFKTVEENTLAIYSNEFWTKEDEFGKSLLNCYPAGTYATWPQETPVEIVSLADCPNINLDGKVKTLDSIELMFSGGVVAWHPDIEGINRFLNAGQNPAERSTNISSQVKSWIMRLISSTVASHPKEAVMRQDDDFLSQEVIKNANHANGPAKRLGIVITGYGNGDFNEPEGVKESNLGPAIARSLVEVDKILKDQYGETIDPSQRFMAAQNIVGQGTNTIQVQQGGGKGRRGRGRGGNGNIIVDRGHHDHGGNGG